jgi:hypothetical protein
LCAIIALGDTGAVADFRGELAQRLEEVPVEAEDAVEGVELRQRGVGGVAIVADEAADNRPILLFCIGLIVLPLRAAAYEVDPFAVAPGDEDMVEEPDGLPIAEGADGDLGRERGGTGAGGGKAAGMGPAMRAQEVVNRGRADAQENWAQRQGEF